MKVSLGSSVALHQVGDVVAWVIALFVVTHFVGCTPAVNLISSGDKVPPSSLPRGSVGEEAIKNSFQVIIDGRDFLQHGFNTKLLDKTPIDGVDLTVSGQGMTPLTLSAGYSQSPISINVPGLSTGLRVFKVQAKASGAIIPNVELWGAAHVVAGGSVTISYDTTLVGRVVSQLLAGSDSDKFLAAQMSLSALETLVSSSGVHGTNLDPASVAQAIRTTNPNPGTTINLPATLTPFGTGNTVSGSIAGTNVSNSLEITVRDPASTSQSTTASGTSQPFSVPGVTTGAWNLIVQDTTANKEAYLTGVASNSSSANVNFSTMSPAFDSTLTFSPRSGFTGGIIHIYGANFSPVPSQNVVIFSGPSFFPTVLRASATELVVRVPAGAASGPISVKTLSGKGVSTASFTANSGPGHLTGFTVSNPDLYSPTLGSQVFDVVLNEAFNRIGSISNANRRAEFKVLSPLSNAGVVNVSAGPTTAVDIALSPRVDGGLLVNNNQVVRFTCPNVIDGIIPGFTAPTSVAIDPSGLIGYVLENSDQSLKKVDLSSSPGSVVGTVALGSATGDLAIHPDGSRAYAVTAGGVKVIDLSGSMSVITTISIGTSPKEIAVSQDGNTLIVANQGDSTISVINTNTNTVASTLSVGASPWGVQISPDSLRAYVGSSTGGVITQIDVANRTVLGNPVDDLAPSSWRGMDMSADGSKLYAAWYDNTSSGKVHVIQ